MIPSLIGLWYFDLQSNAVRIEIPSIDLSATIVPLDIKRLPTGSTWETGSLTQQVGHFTGTSWFGESGNIALGGHSELARGQADIFYNLDQVEVGDSIYVTVDGKELEYIVTSKNRVSIEEVGVLAQTNYEKLTLITCDTQSYTLGGTYDRRLVVNALPA